MGILNQLGRYMNTSNSASTKKAMSATLEAIIGATFLDGNLDAAKTVAQNLGFNVLDETMPRASFALRTRFSSISKSGVASVPANPSIHRTVQGVIKGKQ